MTEASSASQKRGWGQALAVYLDRRQVVIALMGFSSGLPLLLTLSTLTYWLSTLGINKTEIGLFLLTGIPYSFKFVWAPVMDQVAIPVLSRKLGRRRAWALVTQALLAAGILAMGFSNPAEQPLVTAAIACFIAFFSASQDIAIDAYRIEVLEADEQGAGAASTQFGYRIGLLAAGAGAIALADFVSWPWVFAFLAALMLIGVSAVMAAPQSRADRDFTPPETAGLKIADAAGVWLLQSVVKPFLDFLIRPGWWVILLFVLFYKYGDAIGGSMANPFYNEMGFSGVEIASVSKVFGLIMTIVGTFAGGALVMRLGILKALLVGGILQAVTNLLFALLATKGHDITFLAIAIGADNFTGGLGSAAFVAYISSLCNIAFTGTQYALLTSFMAFGRTLFSSGGGWLADNVSWVEFFILSTALAIPGLILLFFVWRLGPKVEKTDAPHGP